MAQTNQKQGMKIPESPETGRINRAPAEGGKVDVEDAIKIQSRDLPAGGSDVKSDASNDMNEDTNSDTTTDADQDQAA